MSKTRHFRRIIPLCSQLVVLGLILLSVWLAVYLVQRRTQLLSNAAADPVRAFPTAEGFGVNTIGGRYGKVYLITNLNDKGEGSLRSCVEASGPRNCVFRTGGTITLSTPINIVNPFITVSGQTAPGGGITLKTTSGGDTLSVETSEVIIRYLTIRPGPGGESRAIQISKNNTELSNIVIDHVSVSWATDPIIYTWYRVRDTTISWSIISESLNCSTHPKGCHSKGLMIGGYKGGEGSTTKGSENISVLNNIMAHNSERNPLVQICGTAQVINNTTYNPLYTFSHQQLNCVNGASYVNWINNFHKKGPDSTTNDDLKVIPSDEGVWSEGHIYVHGNIGPSRPTNDLPDSKWVVVKSGGPALSSTPVSAPSVNTTTAIDAYNKVTASGGAGNSQALDCEGNWVARRDAIDTRVINDVKTGSGKIIDSISETPEKGWINIDSGTPCSDTDNDGLFDDWENRYFHSLSRGSITTSIADFDNDGYTDLEEFLNSTDPTNGATIPSPSPTPSPSPSPSPSPTPTHTPSPTPIPPTTPTPSPSLKPFIFGSNSSLSTHRSRFARWFATHWHSIFSRRH